MQLFHHVRCWQAVLIHQQYMGGALLLGPGDTGVLSSRNAPVFIQGNDVLGLGLQLPQGVPGCEVFIGAVIHNQHHFYLTGKPVN